MAGPTHDIRVPRNRAVAMLVIDVSESMAATDVAPNRLAAAKEAGKQFADELTPGINLGPRRICRKRNPDDGANTRPSGRQGSIDTLQAAERTATGEGIFTALQAICGDRRVLGGGDGPPPARIVLESDGKETVPGDPDMPRGAFTAARAAKDQGVAISTISFWHARWNRQCRRRGDTRASGRHDLQRISEISGGQMFHADSLDQLKSVYATLQRVIGYETISGDASAAMDQAGRAGARSAHWWPRASQPAVARLTRSNRQAAIDQADRAKAPRTPMSTAIRSQPAVAGPRRLVAQLVLDRAELR